jgi:hypothetical protein
MRDFRDAKAMAHSVRAGLAAKGLKITIGESLELIAKAFGAPDWNTLAAAIKAAEAELDQSRTQSVPNQALDGLARALGLEDWDKLRATIQAARLPTPPDGPPTEAQPPQAFESAPKAPTSPSPIPQPRGRSFSATLVETLYRAIGLATGRKHEHTTLEHLLLALVDDADAAEVMQACEMDLPGLKKSLTSYVDVELKVLATGDGEGATPTAAFHRVIRRAVIHVQASGRDDVTGANVLVAIFSERESHAAHFLRRRKLDRFDAVNFIAHGVRKDGGRAA